MRYRGLQFLGAQQVQGSLGNQNDAPGMESDKRVGNVNHLDLIDRVALYLPFVPDENDEFWQTVVESVN